MIWKIQFMQKRKRKNFSPSLFSFSLLAFPFFAPQAKGANPAQRARPLAQLAGPAGA